MDKKTARLSNNWLAVEDEKICWMMQTFTMISYAKPACLERFFERRTLPGIAHEGPAKNPLYPRAEASDKMYSYNPTGTFHLRVQQLHYLTWRVFMGTCWKISRLSISHCLCKSQDNPIMYFSIQELSTVNERFLPFFDNFLLLLTMYVEFFWLKVKRFSEFDFTGKFWSFKLKMLFRMAGGEKKRAAIFLSPF